MMKNTVFSMSNPNSEDESSSSCINLLNYRRPSPKEVVKRKASSTHLSYTSSSISSSFLLKNEKITNLFQPDKGRKESSIYLIEKEKEKFLGRNKFNSVPNVDLEPLEKNNVFMKATFGKESRNTFLADDNIKRSSLSSSKRKHQFDYKLTGYPIDLDFNKPNLKTEQGDLTLAPKFVSKGCLAAFDNDRIQEMSLEFMGFGNAEPPWECINVPKKQELREIIKYRITNFVNPDIVLVIDKYEFFCHRIVLQSYSKFFDSIPSLESKNKIFIDERVTKRAFIAIYSWMLSSGQSGNSYIKISNIIEVLIAANLLGIYDLSEQCTSLIECEEAFSEENAFFLYKDAVRCNNDPIKELMLPRIQKFFLPLVSSLDFLHLSIEDVCVILKSDFILIHCELEVFMAALRWLKSDWENRIKHLICLMKCVRFGLMTPAQLVDIRKNPESPEFMEISQNKHVQLMIEDGLAYAVENTLRGNSGEHQSRCDLLKLVVPQNRNFSSSTKDYKSYNEFLEYLNDIKTDLLNFEIEPIKTTTNDQNWDKNEEIKKVQLEISTEKQAEFSDSQAGVKVDLSNKKTSLKEIAAVVIQSAFRRHLEKKNSQDFKIADIMPNVRIEKEESINYFTQRKIYDTVLVFGGLSPNQKDHYTEKNSVFRYNWKKNVWDVISHLPKPRYYHCATELKHKIYVVGGREVKRCANGVETLCTESLCFDPDEDEWNEEPSLLTLRHNFGLVTLNGCLYAIGGEGKSGRILSSAEQYNPKTREWKNVKPLPEPRIGAAVCCYENCIWVAGGMKSYKPQISSFVYSYDPKEDTWTQRSPLRFGRAFASLVNFKGSLFIIGGATIEGNKISSLDSIDVWDDLTSTWKLKANMAVPRHGQTTAFLGDQILVIGGTSSKYGRTLNEVNAWCVKTNDWSQQISPLPAPIIGHCSVTLPHSAGK